MVKYKAGILIISIICVFLLMSSGYGSWEKELIIKGNIKVVKPTVEPVVEKNIEVIADNITGEAISVQKDKATEEMDLKKDEIKEDKDFIDKSVIEKAAKKDVETFGDGKNKE